MQLRKEDNSAVVSHKTFFNDPESLINDYTQKNNDHDLSLHVISFIFWLDFMNSS